MKIRLAQFAAALQPLRRENTVLPGLQRGGWSRVLPGWAQGMLDGAPTYATCTLAGVIAEHWRGKMLTQVYQAKKSRAVPTVSKKAP